MKYYKFETVQRKTAVAETIERSAASPQEVYEFARDTIRLDEAMTERFIIILLNSKLRIVGYEVVSIGGLNSTSAHPREVFRPAIVHGAHAVICLHNHPSGDPSPSPEDIKLTDMLVKAGEILEIDVLDHIIYAEGCYCSLREKGCIR